MMPITLASSNWQYYGLDLDYVPPPVAANALIAGSGGTTNWITNPRVEGAIVGTPGTVPSYWNLDGVAPGVTYQVVGTGTESGLSYVDLRLFGTMADANYTLALNLNLNTVLVPGFYNETWTSSIYTRLMAGAFPAANGNEGITLMTYALNAAYTVVYTYGFTLPNLYRPTNAPLITQRFSGSGGGPRPWYGSCAA